MILPNFFDMFKKHKQAVGQSKNAKTQFFPMIWKCFFNSRVILQKKQINMWQLISSKKNYENWKLNNAVDKFLILLHAYYFSR